ncbi:MAG: response regulator [Spirosomataceae bacterium]
MLRTVVVEDNSAEMANILDFLTQGCPQVEVIGTAYGVDEAVEQITSTKPDLLITDVQIMGGTCYHLLEKLNAKQQLQGLSIIFMTAHHDIHQAARAFRYATVDFLVKPFELQELKRAVEEVSRQQEPIQHIEQLRLLIEYLSPTHAREQRIAVTLVGGKLQMIEINDIRYLEAKATMTLFYLKTLSQPLVANKNLGYFVNTLQNNVQFFSISNSCLINLSELHSYEHSESAVRLKDYPITLYASRHGGQRLKQQLTTPTTPNQNDTLRTFFKRLIGK